MAAEATSPAAAAELSAGMAAESAAAVLAGGTSSVATSPIGTGRAGAHCALVAGHTHSARPPGWGRL